MKGNYILPLAIFATWIFYSAKPIDDDSIKYVRVDRVYIPNPGCDGYWATMTNFSAHSGGPNKKIRVYYTVNNKSMVCETKPMAVIPIPNPSHTLLGCWGPDYKINRSEYIE